MRHRSLTLALAFIVFAGGLGIPRSLSADDAPPAVPSFVEPAIAPDGAEIAFVSGGDIWSVPAGGGRAQLLVAADGYAARPLYSPDGTRLAFVSSRPGAAGIYVVRLDGGEPMRVTYTDFLPTLSGWSADSRNIYYSTPANNIDYFADVMRVPAAGGTSMRVVTEPYVNSADGVASNDGSAIAYARNGFVQWWRRGHAHIDEAEIVVYHPGAKTYDTVAPADAKNRWPMWSPDGSLTYVSDRSGHDELWAWSSGRAHRLTSLNGEGVLWPTITRSGRTVAFEHDLGVWTYDAATGTTHRVPIALHGVPTALPVAHVTLSSSFSDLVLSPDGKKIAFTGRGRVFAAAASSGGVATAVPAIAGAAESTPRWAPDSRRLAFTVDRGTETGIATYAFPDGPLKVVTPAGHFDDYVHWSPDGTMIAFVRDGNELHLMNVASGSDRVVARAAMDRSPFGDLGDIAFSPAGDWLAFISDLHAGGFSGVSVVPVNGGEPRTISDLPDNNAGPLAWAPDGTRLYFVTSQRTEPGQVAQIDLQPRPPHFQEDQFRQLFAQPHAPVELPVRTAPLPATSATPAATAAPSASPAPKPAPARTAIDFAGITQRVSFLQTGLDVSYLRVTPDGKTLVLIASAAGQQNLYTFGVDDTADGPAVARQITNSLGSKSNIEISPDGASVYYLGSGRAADVPLAGGAARPIALSAALDVDFDGEKDLVARQAWSLLDRWYADPAFHGADWPAVLHAYEPHVLASRTRPELLRVLRLMIGELNSSHLDIVPAPSGVPRFALGRLGVQYDTDVYERTGAVRIAEITPLGPLALAGHVAAGDDIIAVNGRQVARNVDIDALLLHTIGARTVLRIAPHGDVAAAHDVTVLPVDGRADQGLRYTAWVAARRAYVERISGGRLGYVHVQAMDDENLAKFGHDLDVRNRAKAGVIVDIRNNDGGFIDPYANDVLSRRPYATFRPRFGTNPSERSTLGQRALELPTALVTNSHSLSDAESFSEGYHTLRTGPIVGTPTAGWIIFTSNAPALADGGTIRLPTTNVVAHDGAIMELHPRPVDVPVDNPPGAAARGDDPQLDAAVRALLHRLK